MNRDLIAGSGTLALLAAVRQAISYDERLVRLKETKMRVTVKFGEEHTFGMLIAKYGDEVTSHTTEMAAKDILSRLIGENYRASIKLNSGYLYSYIKDLLFTIHYILITSLQCEIIKLKRSDGINCLWTRFLKRLGHALTDSAPVSQKQGSRYTVITS